MKEMGIEVEHDGTAIKDSEVPKEVYERNQAKGAEIEALQTRYNEIKARLFGADSAA